MNSLVVSINGQHVLNMLYQRSGMYWKELCREFDAVDENLMPLVWCLQSLDDADLVTVDNLEATEYSKFFEYCTSPRYELRETCRIRASSRWRKVSYALATDFTRHSYPNRQNDDLRYTLSVTPMFGAPSRLAKQMDVFVAMPFAAELEPVFTKHILPIVEATPFVWPSNGHFLCK